MFKRFRSVLIIMCLLLVLLVGSYFIWSYSANKSVNLHIPTPPPMPHPNAMDFYLKADAKLCAVTIPGSKGKQLSQLWDALYGKPYSQKEKEQMLAATQAGLATLRQGFNYPYQSLPVRSYDISFPEYAKERDLARYLRFAAETKAAHNDWGGAVECDLDSLRLGSDIPNHSVLIGMLVGIALQAIGRTNAWDVSTHLNAAQARAACERLQRIIDRRTSLADTLQEEKWGFMSAMQEMLQHADWRMQIIKYFFANSDKLTRLKLMTQLYFTNKNEIFQQFNAYMDKMSDEANKPFLERQAVPIPKNILLKILCPVYAKAGEKVVINELENNLLLVSFALQAYKAEHGTYPTTLSALTPAYLARIPADPFAPASKLRYRVIDSITLTSKNEVTYVPTSTLRYRVIPSKQKGGAAKYLLYSVGPDGKDDGGRPIEDKSSSGAQRYYSFYNGTKSDGDIVAGVNTY